MEGRKYTRSDPKIILKSSEDFRSLFITDKEKANAYAKVYSKICNPRIQRSRQQRHQRHRMRVLRCRYIASIGKDAALKDQDEKPFSLYELDQALLDLPMAKAPGPDGIYNEMLKHMNKPIKKLVLHLHNMIWSTGVFPRRFREGICIPILKPNKPEDLPDGYRPVVLLSCLSKLHETMVQRRLTHTLEERQPDSVPSTIRIPIESIHFGPISATDFRCSSRTPIEPGAAHSSS